MRFRDQIHETSHSVGIVWTSDQPEAETSDNKQHSEEINIHAPGGILTHDPSTRAVAHPRLRPPGPLQVTIEQWKSERTL